MKRVTYLGKEPMVFEGPGFNPCLVLPNESIPMLDASFDGLCRALVTSLFKVEELGPGPTEKVEEPVKVIQHPFVELEPTPVTVANQHETLAFPQAPIVEERVIERTALREVLAAPKEEPPAPPEPVIVPMPSPIQDAFNTIDKKMDEAKPGRKQIKRGRK